MDYCSPSTSQPELVKTLVFNQRLRAEEAGRRLQAEEADWLQAFLVNWLRAGLGCRE